MGFAGRSVDWVEDKLDLGTNNLRHLAVEQAGGIGHERIWTWLHDTGLTLEQAAEALGISRRMLIYCRDGEKPIPRSIWVACLGWEAVRPNLKVAAYRCMHPPCGFGVEVAAGSSGCSGQHTVSKATKGLPEFDRVLQAGKLCRDPDRARHRTAGERQNG